jgi:hypothetical protein
LSTLTVGVGKEFSTISAAVAASHDGDVIAVDAGTYTNDFATITTKITIEGVGGVAHLVATTAPSKAILVTDADVTINHLEFSGAANADGNGAGIRYEAGNLVIANSYFHDNQDGLLAADNPSGSITIANSEFSHNGAGDGFTHNLYVGKIANLTVTNSYFHDAVLGHEIKSRAANTNISNSRIFDGPSGTAIYSIDLPIGGNAVLSNNVIEQGPNSQNPIIVAFGEAGGLYANSSLQLTRNTILNDLPSASARLLSNATSITASLSDNGVFGLTSSQYVNGPATIVNMTTLNSEPALDTSSPVIFPIKTDDFNNDGNSDVLFRSAGTGDTGFFSISNGATTGWHGIAGSSTAYSAVGVGDLNDDGTNDILFRNNTTGDVGFYAIHNGALTGWHDIGVSSTAYSIAGVGDFNGDGVSDVLFRNNSTGDAGFFQLNSKGELQGWHAIGGSSTAYNVVGVGDFNGDGVSDVLFRNATSGDTGYFRLNNGGTLQGWHDIGASSTAYDVVGVGDFNRDALSDVLFRNAASGDVGYYQMNSNGTLQGWHDIGGSSTAYSVAGVGDYNGDGVSDVLFRNAASGDIGFYQLNGNGTLEGWHPLGSALTSYAVIS